MDLSGESGGELSGGDFVLAFFAEESDSEFVEEFSVGGAAW